MTKSYNRSAILRAAWSRARWVAEAVGRPVREIIGGAMRQCWALAKGLAAPVVAVEMVPQPAQMQQAQAGVPADTLSKAGAAKAEVERVKARCAVLREEKRAAYALLRECRREWIAAVAGELDACPGVCWTNEERAEAAADEATDALDRCLNDYWEACDYLREEDREERRATLKARIAQGPSMVLQPVQQAQACAIPAAVFAARAKVAAIKAEGTSLIDDVRVRRVEAASAYRAWMDCLNHGRPAQDAQARYSEASLLVETTLKALWDRGGEPPHGRA